MLDVFFGFLSLVLAASGVFCLYEARSYTDEQRARAPRLWRAYAASGVFLSIVGVGTIAWLLSGGSIWTPIGIASIAAALPCLVQARLHQQLDVDRSPLAARVAENVARTLNFPDANRQV